MKVIQILALCLMCSPLYAADFEFKMNPNVSISKNGYSISGWSSDSAPAQIKQLDFSEKTSTVEQKIELLKREICKMELLSKHQLKDTQEVTKRYPKGTKLTTIFHEVMPSVPVKLEGGTDETIGDFEISFSPLSKFLQYIGVVANATIDYTDNGIVLKAAPENK